MSDRWSDGESSDTATSSGRSHASYRSKKLPSKRDETRAMAHSIKRNRGKSDELVIAVVRNGSVEEMIERLPDTKSWYEYFLKKKSEVVVTTAALLQSAITSFERQGLRALKIITSGEIEHIGFHVASKFEQLKLHRCGFGRNAHGDLLVNGASTFRKVRLDEWEGVSPRQRRGEIWLHPGVAIEADTTRDLWARAQRTFTGSDADKESLRSHLSSMEETEMSRDGWWKNWRAPVAAILGILAGGAGFAGAVTATAAGAYVNFAWGPMSLKAGTAVVTATGAVCGGAILLGTGVAAAVYFVPWGGVFNMLRSALSWLWDKVVSLYDRFQSWWTAFWSSGRRGEHYGRAPMMA